MPQRWLREKILTSEKVDQLLPPEEVFYRRLMSVVDDYGRFDGRPSVLRAACYPLRLDKVREADISRWIAACEKAGLIVLYEIEGKSYVWLLNLGQARAETSKFPDPPGDARKCFRVSADVSDAPVLRITNTNTNTSNGVHFSRGKKQTGAEGLKQRLKEDVK